jgi:hypothetical protein
MCTIEVHNGLRDSDTTIEMHLINDFPENLVSAKDLHKHVLHVVLKKGKNEEGSTLRQSREQNRSFAIQIQNSLQDNDASTKMDWNNNLLCTLPKKKSLV